MNMVNALKRPETGNVTHQAKAMFLTMLHWTADRARYQPTDTTAPTWTYIKYA